MTDPPELGTRALVLALAMALLALVSWSTFANDVPSTTSPWSVAVVIPVAFWGEVVGVTFLPLAFLLWSVNLVAGKIQLPLRSIVLLSLLSLSCAIWFVTAWKYGIQYEGIRFTLFWAAVDVTLASMLCVLAVRFRRAPSWQKVLLFHWLLFAWSAWCAFPWLGEQI